MQPLRPAALRGLDWAAIAAYIAVCVTLAVWLWRRRRAQRGAEGFALASRRLPWWVIGIADVATGDGADAFWVYVFFVGGFVGIYRFYWVSAILSLPLGIFWARYYRRLALPSPGYFFAVRYGGRAARAFRVLSTVYGVAVGHAVLIGYGMRNFPDPGRALRVCLDIADLRDGRRKPLSQPSTRHGTAGLHSHSRGALRGSPLDTGRQRQSSAAGEGFPLRSWECSRYQSADH